MTGTLQVHQPCKLCKHYFHNLHSTLSINLPTTAAVALNTSSSSIFSLILSLFWSSFLLSLFPFSLSLSLSLSLNHLNGNDASKVCLFSPSSTKLKPESWPPRLCRFISHLLKKHAKEKKLLKKYISLSLCFLSILFLPLQTIGKKNL